MASQPYLNSQKIQACSNKFLRMIFFLKPRESVRSIMKENNLLSVNQIYQIEIAKLMHRVNLNSIPSPFHGQIRTDISAKSGSRIIQGHTSTAKCGQSIRCTGPKIWNALPRSLRFLSPDEIDNLTPVQMNVFKTKIKTYSIENIDFI